MTKSILIAAACLAMFGCRSTKRTVNTQHAQRDSISRTVEVGTKETSIRETTIGTVTHNPGDLSGTFSTLDTSGQTIESDGYKLTLKSDGKGKAQVDVKGKDQQIQVPGEKTTSIKEANLQKTQTAVQEKYDQVVKEKTATGIPWYVWAGAALVGIGIVVIFAFLKHRGPI